MTFADLDALGNAARGHVLRPGEGHAIALPGWAMSIKVAAADTGGALTLIEATMAPHHDGPLEHVHLAHDEAFFLLEGTLRFRVGDGYRAVVPGEVVFASRGLAHGFSNPSDRPARYLAALTPSGYEVYFERVAELVRRSGAPPSRAALLALMAEHGTYPALPAR